MKKFQVKIRKEHIIFWRLFINFPFTNKEIYILINYCFISLELGDPLSEFY